MILRFKSNKDTTIYESSLIASTGEDEILEVSKTVNPTYNSRILMKFDLDQIVTMQGNGQMRLDANFYLKMHATEPSELPLSETIFIYPISGSWTADAGKFYNDPTSSAAANWEFKDSNTKWKTGSYSANTTGSWQTNEGGGNWYTSSVASQSYSRGPADLRTNVTDIIRNWLTGSFANDGFIIRRDDSAESGSALKGNLQFFSSNTNTIWEPALEAAWDDSTFATGTLLPLNDENITLYSNNLRSNYVSGSRVKVRFNGRSTFPTRSFSTTSGYKEVKYLPETSYYSIKDVVTDETIIPYNDIYTKISCDVVGNYINLWTDTYPINRYFKIVFKVVRNGNIEFYDNNLHFKVVR